MLISLRNLCKPLLEEDWSYIIYLCNYKFLHWLALKFNKLKKKCGLISLRNLYKNSVQRIIFNPTEYFPFLTVVLCHPIFLFVAPRPRPSPFGYHIVHIIHSFHSRHVTFHGTVDHFHCYGCYGYVHGYK